MRAGSRDATDCTAQPGGSCTRISRPPTSPDETERCFGDANACARYRAYVIGNGLTAAECTDA
jgi:hypothetical protein